LRCIKALGALMVLEQMLMGPAAQAKAESRSLTLTRSDGDWKICMVRLV